MIDKLQSMINESKYIVFFGGAGVSTDSGIKDFRGSNGLYKDNPEYLLSTECFYEEPEKFYEFYKNNLNSLNVKPNITHKYLAKLEEQGKLKAVITQNIDGLHTNAGSKNVYEIHGTTRRNYCMKCHKFYDDKYIFNSKDIPRCSCNGIIKPDVVLYEEELDYDVLNTSIKYISNADTLIIAGTSLNVYPAAGLVRYFKGNNLIIINKDTTNMDSIASLVINDDLKKVFINLKI